MISKIGVAVILSVATMLFAAPTNAFAVSKKTQIAVLLKQLKSLPKGSASPAKVKALVTKLAKLDPIKSSTYLKTATAKLDPAVAEKIASQLAKTVSTIVEKSNLPDSVKDKLINKIDKVIDNIPPYQAMILSGEVLA
jgi:hypothetical protein